MDVSELELRQKMLLRYNRKLLTQVASKSPVRVNQANNAAVRNLSLGFFGKELSSVDYYTKTSISGKQPFSTIPNFSSVSEDPESFYAPSETTKSNAEWDAESSPKWTPQLTKIVATIGPTSEQMDVLQQVVRGGMRIMRLNFSHATVDEVELRSKNLAACKVSIGREQIIIFPFIFKLYLTYIFSYINRVCTVKY